MLKIFNKKKIAENIENTGSEYLCDSCRYYSIACDPYCTMLRIPLYNKKYKCQYYINSYREKCPDKVENPNE